MYTRRDRGELPFKNINRHSYLWISVTVVLWSLDLIGRQFNKRNGDATQLDSNGTLLLFLGQGLLDILDHLAGLRRILTFRLQTQILLEHLQRVGGVFRFQEQVASKQIRFGVIRVELQRLSDFWPCFGDIAFGEIDLTQDEMALDRFRFEFQSLKQFLFSFGIFLLLP